jgi:hypothetical protein
MSKLDARIHHGDLNVSIRHGGGGPDLASLTGVVLAAATAAVLVLLAFLAAALAIAGTVVFIAVWFGTRRCRAARRAAVTEALEAGRKRREAEIEDRRPRQAQAVAAAQAQAIAPYAAAAVAAALHRQPETRPVRVPVRMLPGTAEEVHHG